MYGLVAGVSVGVKVGCFSCILNMTLFKSFPVSPILAPLSFFGELRQYRGCHQLAQSLDHGRCDACDRSTIFREFTQRFLRVETSPRRNRTLRSDLAGVLH